MGEMEHVHKPTGLKHKIETGVCVTSFYYNMFPPYYGMHTHALFLEGEVDECDCIYCVNYAP